MGAIMGEEMCGVAICCCSRRKACQNIEIWQIKGFASSTCYSSRLANKNDYTPDINGIIGLKCFILAKLIEQNDLQLYPGLFAHAEAADEEQGYAAQFEVLMNGEGQNVVHILDPEADRQELEDLKKALLLSKHELNRLEAKESGSVKACVIDLL